jgi:GTP diphosphokinase / guanosine-3',5'-bis(diphosphate) 3'-diphosphatase
MLTIAPTAEEIITMMESPSEQDVDLITRAYARSQEAHAPHTRYSGEPFFVHPATVALYLSEMGMDAKTIAAGLLHDSIEDAGLTKEEIVEKFGSDVYHLIEGVTKLGHVRYRGLERHAESLRKLFAATAQDVRVIIIKLSDRLHNARTLMHVPEHKRQRIALETLEVYAQIADRLGMSVMKKDLEDAAFPHAYPQVYEKVLALFTERTTGTAENLKRLEADIAEAMAIGGVSNFRIRSRKKGLYSLYKKLVRKEWDVDSIYDITALRVIVSDVAACYQALGVVHGTFRPLPGKLKDYIAFPKPNGYQSIHTTVHAENTIIEIQIRTEEMHKYAEYGLAAHLSYKEGRAKRKKGASMQWVEQFFPERLSLSADEQAQQEAKGENHVPRWIKSIANVQDNEHDEYIETLKNDFFSHRIFLFTPRGDVVDLPAGATPIDFAYAIHSALGEHIAGAKVNGKLIAIESQLHNGDIVEIITKDSAHPNKKWLDIVKTSMARKHIRAAIMAQTETQRTSEKTSQSKKIAPTKKPGNVKR